MVLERRDLDAQALAGERKSLGAQYIPGRGNEEGGPSLGNGPEHDEFGLEQVDQDRHQLAQAASRTLGCAQRRSVAGRRSRTERLGIEPLGFAQAGCLPTLHGQQTFFLRELGEPRPAQKALGAATLTKADRPLVAEAHVPDLTSKASAPRIELTVEDQPGPHTRAHRQEDQTLTSLPHAPALLRQRERIGIVGRQIWNMNACGKRVPQGEAVPARHIGWIEEALGRREVGPWAAHAQRSEVALPRQALEGLVEDRCGARLTIHRKALRPAHAAIACRQANSNFAATDVETGILLRTEGLLIHQDEHTDEHEEVPQAQSLCPPDESVQIAFILSFVVSRALAWACGLRYSTEHMDSMMHFIDSELLRSRPLESLFYLHSQPPLFHAFEALVLQLPPAWQGPLLHGSFLALSLTAGLMLLSIGQRLGLPARLAFAIALAFVLLPGVLIYENYFFFTLPLIFCSILACWLLLRALQGKSWMPFFMALALLCLLKAVFHPVFFGLVLLAIVFYARGRRRQILLAAIPGLVLTLAWPSKNLLVFGRFESSSWLGFGLARKTWHRWPQAGRLALIQKGLLDPIAAVPLYAGPRAYERALLGPGARTKPWGVALLDRYENSAGHPNYHHAIYLQLMPRMRAEALRWMHLAPAFYAEDVLRATREMFRPEVHWGPVARPYQQIKTYADSVDALRFARLGLTGLTPWTLLCLLAMGSLAMAILRGRAPPDAHLALQAFAVFAWLWICVLGVTLDTGETERFRFSADGLLCVALVVFLARSVPRAHGQGDKVSDSYRSLSK